MSLRASTTASDSVWSVMPSRSSVAQAGMRLGRPSTSTTQSRHDAAGLSVSWWQRVGMSMPRSRAASRIVVPAGTVTSKPSMVAWMVAVSASAGPVMPPPFACSTAASGAAPRATRASTAAPRERQDARRRLYGRSLPGARGGSPSVQRASAGAKAGRARGARGPRLRRTDGRRACGAALQAAAAVLLCAPADAAQHALFHDEVCGLKTERLREGGRHRAPPRRARADDEARLGGAGRFEVEAPGPGHLAAEQAACLLRRLTRRAATHHERARRFEDGDGHLHGLVGVEREVVLAGAQVLPLGVHAVGAADVEAGQVLERVVGVEAAAVLADLDEPRPDGLGGGAHRDGVRRRVQRVGRPGRRRGGGARPRRPSLPSAAGAAGRRTSRPRRGPPWSPPQGRLCGGASSVFLDGRAGSAANAGSSVLVFELADDARERGGHHLGAGVREVDAVGGERAAAVCGRGGERRPQVDDAAGAAAGRRAARSPRPRPRLVPPTASPRPRGRAGARRRSSAPAPPSTRAVLRSRRRGASSARASSSRCRPRTSPTRP